jgi:hypothetical protein
LLLVAQAVVEHQIIVVHLAVAVVQVVLELLSVGQL